MRTCLKWTPASGAVHEMMVPEAVVTEEEEDFAVSAVTGAVVVVFAETGPVARRVVIADLLALGGAPVNGATTALVLVGTGEAAEIAVDSGDVMTATAGRVSKLRQPSPGCRRSSSRRRNPRKRWPRRSARQGRLSACSMPRGWCCRAVTAFT
jgi:hypothetical protein